MISVKYIKVWEKKWINMPSKHKMTANKVKYKVNISETNNEKYSKTK